MVEHDPAVAGFVPQLPVRPRLAAKLGVDVLREDLRARAEPAQDPAQRQGLL